jgi:hypothetical protein
MRGLADEICFARMTSDVDVEVDGVEDEGTGEGERLREERVEGRPLGFLKNGTRGFEVDDDVPGEVVEDCMM